MKHIIANTLKNYGTHIGNLKAIGFAAPFDRRNSDSFEHKGFILCGMKMMQLDEKILDEHYAHLVDKPFYPRIKKV